MIDYFNHFTKSFGTVNERVRKNGNFVFTHLPYLFESLLLFKDSKEPLVFCCEGGDVVLGATNDGFTLGNTSGIFKKLLFSEFNPNIKRVFSTNLNFFHEKFSVLPAGLYSPPEMIKNLQGTKKETLCLANFSYHQGPTPSAKERTEIMEFVRKNNWITEQFQGFGDGKPSTTPLIDLLTAIAKTKFLICPISGGLETSRLHEAWNLGAVPICRRLPFFELLQKEGFPLIILDSWSELDKIKLENTVVGPEVWETVQPLLTNEYWINKIKNA